MRSWRVFEKSMADLLQSSVVLRYSYKCCPRTAIQRSLRYPVVVVFFCLLSRLERTRILLCQTFEFVSAGGVEDLPTHQTYFLLYEVLRPRITARSGCVTIIIAGLPSSVSVFLLSRWTDLIARGALTYVWWFRRMMCSRRT